VPVTYTVLGTDGFGRSDTRKNLRRHFEVNSNYITLATIKTLADEGKFEASNVKEAIKKYGIDVNKLNPIQA
jgi:pyruvate dehydrogenase E1 component